MMKRLFPLIAALLATIGPVLADDLTGQASVIDGDNGVVLLIKDRS
jgi:hypothetical protein